MKGGQLVSPYIRWNTDKIDQPKDELTIVLPKGAIRQHPRHCSTSTVLGLTISEACHARKCTSNNTFEPVDAALPATITARIKDRQMGESVTRVRKFLVTENEKDRDKSAKF